MANTTPYSELENLYPETLIIRKEGPFYMLRNDSARVFHAHFENKGWRNQNGAVSIGIQENRISEVIGRLDQLSITYVVLNNEEMVGGHNFGDNNRFNEFINTPIDDIPFAKSKKEVTEPVSLLSEHEKKLAQISTTYLTRMMDGIHPVYNTPIPEDSVLSDNNIRKCFSFITDVLTRLMEYTPEPNTSSKVSSSALSRSTTRAFHFTDNYLDVISGLLTNTELRVTKFEPILKANINKIISEEDCTINTYKLSGWLLDNGYLEKVVKPDGNSFRQATELGIKCGIVNRLINNGDLEPYTAYQFTRLGQQFIYDNLPQICSYHKKKS